MGSSTLLVTNLHNTTTKDELEDLFSAHGRVRQVEIGSVKGGGSVEMFKKSEAKRAVMALDGSEFKCLTLKVQESRPFKNGGRRRKRGR